jgi:rubredoxin
VQARDTIPSMHECPLCGEAMRLSERQVREMNGTVRQVREWICPECDYFEEADTEG